MREPVPVQWLGFSVAEPCEARSGGDASDGVEGGAEPGAELRGEAVGGFGGRGEQEFVVFASAGGHADIGPGGNGNAVGVDLCAGGRTVEDCLLYTSPSPRDS